MALDPIWKQQLTLVTYGNEYLTHGLSVHQWRQIPIFDQHTFAFRDLLSQHLLAQHFQIWLENLKKQGVTRLSLHASSMLNEEKNPNPNIELLPYSHFIVSHHDKKKTAWVFGNELAEWFNTEQEFMIPDAQQSSTRQETLWNFELNSKLYKKIQADLQAPEWDRIQQYLTQELFNTTYAQNVQQQHFTEQHYTGFNLTQPNKIAFDLEEKSALLPAQYQANLSNELLLKLEALELDLAEQAKIQSEESQVFASADEKRAFKHFSQKLDDLFAKLIVKTANHYQTAQRKIIAPETPFETPAAAPQTQSYANVNLNKSTATEPHKHQISNKNVVTLIIMTILICVLAYYFGF
ncbi:hypothetical protein [Acinetobacter sp. MB5]|uniref:hypothetical protein n=1 Tax=Acinetobacter sp. MB5 TaxID=2069438 RepID=UPI000DD03AEA|nr:hypothetical protein [Acinetobacter sp. MB5]